MKVLVIDDELNIAKGIRNILKGQISIPYNVVITDDSKKALTIVKTFKPDLVITDIVMPFVTGLNIIEQLRKDNLCEYFIILSGYDKFSYAQTALRCGAVDYLLKPVDKVRLLEQCEKVYHGLPGQYARLKSRTLPEHPYFSWNLHNHEYPASLQQAIAYVEKNYMKDISLELLSEELFLHPNYISSLINKHTGHSFTYLLDYIRIRKAAELLLYDNPISISEISYIVGYNNERRLYNAFQKRLNSTPRDFKISYGKIS